MDHRPPHGRAPSIFEQFLASVGFGPTEAAALRDLYPRIRERFAPIAADVAAHAQEHDGTRRFVVAPEQRARLERCVHRWMEEVFLGPHDEAYFLRRRTIAETHRRVGLAEIHVVAALSRLRRRLEAAAAEAVGSWRDRETRLEALAKILDIEAALLTCTCRDQERYRDHANTACEILGLDPAECVAKDEVLREALVRLERAASTDPVTGLNNHLFVERRLEEEVERSLRAGPSLCCLVVDIDGFKAVNDAYGHLVGDALLRAFAQVLDRARREYDVLGRWGGDEFAYVLTSSTRDAGLAFARKLLASLAERELAVGSVRLRLSASMGLAACPDDARSAPDLFAAADLAMYRAKRQGGECVSTCDAPRPAERSPLG